MLSEAATRLFLNFASFKAGKANRILNQGIESVLWMTDSNFTHPRVCHLFQLQAKVYLYTFAFQCKYNLLSNQSNNRAMIFDDVLKRSIPLEHMLIKQTEQNLCE